MRTLITALRALGFFTVLTGIVYPLLVTGIARLAFPDKADGSLIVKNNRVIGSRLIGQQFDSTIYFFSRPSAVSYNPLPSGASNLGLTNPELKKKVDERAFRFNILNGSDSLNVVPSEMLFASGSGLDPHISVLSAELQVDRIARARGFDQKSKMELINTIGKMTEEPQFGFLGVQKINVLLLNIELDKKGDFNSANR